MSDSRQITADVFLVRPHHFGPNTQTAQSNFFQRQIHTSLTDVQASALNEFDGMVGALRDAGVNAMVFQDTDDPSKPDAVFPNNWVSLHGDGTAILYPMEAPSRRPERRIDIVESLSNDYGFFVSNIVDLSFLEGEGLFLEGTGSLVLDHVQRAAYAALSSRTHMMAAAEFARQAKYEIAAFEAADSSGRAIYHTNVMMTIGQRFAVICADSIVDRGERSAVMARLVAGGRVVVEITVSQMEQFAGNILELATADERSVILMSRSAYEALSSEQIETLESCGKIIPVAVPTIESVGGGSVRCMMTEVFLPVSSSMVSK